MLDRNRRIKQHPEKFQTSAEQFNIIITCEERVYDQVVECMETVITYEHRCVLIQFSNCAGLEAREGQTTPVHVINIDIQDNHEEATIGAFLICELVGMVCIAACFLSLI